MGMEGSGIDDTDPTCSGNFDTEKIPWKAENVVAGMGAPLQALRELLLWPVMYAKDAQDIGLQWPKGLLLYGPPGTGKVNIQSMNQSSSILNLRICA